MYGEGNTNSTTPLIWIDITGGKFHFEHRDNSSNDMNIVSKKTINDNFFHYFVAVKLASNSWQIFIDGMSDGTSSTSIGTTITNNSKIGAIQRSFLEHYFNGLIDDVRIYNAALSSSEIKQNYIAGLNSMLANGNMSKQEYNERLEFLSLN